MTVLYQVEIFTAPEGKTSPEWVVCYGDSRVRRALDKYDELVKAGQKVRLRMVGNVLLMEDNPD